VRCEKFHRKTGIEAAAKFYSPSKEEKGQVTKKIISSE
jgi:hypothetical protein